MLSPDRRRRLLSLIRSQGSVQITGLEKTLDVSRMTLYRDLEALVAEGLVQRVHGGVIALEGGAVELFVDPRAHPLEERITVARLEKEAIARHLVTVLSTVRTAVVDNSSTIFMLSQVLPGSPHELFLVTGGVSLYVELQRRAVENIRVAIHGGEPHPRTGSLVGPMAQGGLNEMRFDMAAMSCLGVVPDEDAVFVSNAEEAEVKRTYMARARRKVLAIDGGKLGRSGPYRLCKLSEFDLVITESGPKPPAALIAAAKQVLQNPSPLEQP